MKKILEKIITKKALQNLSKKRKKRNTYCQIYQKIKNNVKYSVKISENFLPSISKKENLGKRDAIFFQKIANYEKRSDKFIKKCKISENVLANFPNN